MHYETGQQTRILMNKPSGTRLVMDLSPAVLMHPPFGTDFLIQHMDIHPGETVLDASAGTGLVGVAAILLGASHATLAAMHPGAETRMKQNVLANIGMTNTISITPIDLFQSLNTMQCDHIVANPQAIPVCADAQDMVPIRSEHEEYETTSALIATSKYYLTEYGRLTMVHRARSDLDTSLEMLRRHNFSYRLSGPCATAGDTATDEAYYVIAATLEERIYPRALSMVQEKGIAYRMLAHRREAKPVEDAVRERGVPIEEMIKCIFLKDKKGRFVLACLTGNATLDIQRIRTYLQGYSRLSFASADEISSILGYEQGSVAPINLKTPIPVILDTAITWNQRVNISSGDPRLGLELCLEDLLACLDNPLIGEIATWDAPVAPISLETPMRQPAPQHQVAL